MGTPLADSLLGPAVAEELAACLERSRAVKKARAVRAAAGDLDGRTMSARMALLRDALLSDLPAGWPAFDRAIRKALGDEAFRSWMTWPAGEAAAIVSLERSDPPATVAGLDLLAALTPRLSSEFALRPFLAHDLEGTLAVARGWTG